MTIPLSSLFLQGLTVSNSTHNAGSQKAHYVAVRLQNFIGVYALLGKSLLAPLSAAIDALSPITRPTLPQSFL